MSFSESEDSEKNHFQVHLKPAIFHQDISRVDCALPSGWHVFKFLFLAIYTSLQFSFLCEILRITFPALSN